MTPERVAASSTYDVMDTALHDEIKRRAYELYERQGDDMKCQDRRNELQSELLRVVYAAAQIQMHSNGELHDNKACRAARVYLRALSSFIGQS
jgi:hypothetical protein